MAAVVLASALYTGKQVVLLKASKQRLHIIQIMFEMISVPKVNTVGIAFQIMINVFTFYYTVTDIYTV